MLSLKTLFILVLIMAVINPPYYTVTAGKRDGSSSESSESSKSSESSEPRLGHNESHSTISYNEIYAKPILIG
ncbi:hypothetical protein B7P43_G15991 [Cryptotermes secundus]|uniref:Uncharacterized protein n=1 Tax=Cryptotermes secundus TaxID=105785 RepID=A0A2J7PFH3_9NEOP|nr:hypothetical protein B7P43_G15991 [Cryptotermes secundus]